MDNLKVKQTTPQPVIRNGYHIVKIIAVEECQEFIIVQYEFAVGPNAGWATRIFNRTKKWVFGQKIHRRNGNCILEILKSAVQKAEPDRLIVDMKQVEQCFVCVDVVWEKYKGLFYPKVKHIFDKDTYKPAREDLIIGTRCWAKGSADVNHAVELACFSPYPTLLTDTQERDSPMVEYAVKHQICVLPTSGLPGDYMLSNGDIIVDRKASICELYGNFAHSDSWHSYQIAAMKAAANKMTLVFVVGVDPDENVRELNDLMYWRHTLPDGCVLKGVIALDQIKIFMKPLCNVHFLFVSKKNQCDAIWKTICGEDFFEFV